MRTAITSIAEGKEWATISEFTFDTFERYAKRIGADFVPLRGRKFPTRHFHWEKISMATLLSSYDRVFWVDADAIIRSTAGSIFDLVPEDHFGAFDEGHTHDREQEFQDGSAFYGTKVPEPAARPFKYFNAGIMVFSRIHAEAFRLPELSWDSSGMPEQTYMNTMVYKLGFKYFDIGSTWNGFHWPHQNVEDRDKLNILHYAGWPKEEGWVEAMLTQMKKDYR